MIKRYEFKNREEAYTWRGQVFDFLKGTSKYKELGDFLLMVNQVQYTTKPEGMLDIYDLHDCAVVVEHELPQEKSPRVSIIGAESAIEKLVKDFLPTVTSIPLREPVNKAE